MNSILRITDPIPSDDSMDRYEDIGYEPVVGTSLNNSGGDIRFFTHPSESFLIIEGRFLRADNNNSYGNNDLITLTNNGVMHLFKSIRYELSGQEIEKIMHPGQATTMLGLLKYLDDFSRVTNPSIFDDVNVSNIYVMLNSIRYPTADYNISFLAQKFSRVYVDSAEFRSKFFNMDGLISNLNINPSDNRALYPLFLFDVSKQSEKLKYSTTDIQIKMHFSMNVPLNTQAYAVSISNRLINFQSYGNKMSVVY